MSKTLSPWFALLVPLGTLVFGAPYFLTNAPTCVPATAAKPCTAPLPCFLLWRLPPYLLHIFLNIGTTRCKDWPPSWAPCASHMSFLP